jgi:hypothetical protein
LHPIEEELSMKLKLETYPTFNNENLKYFLDVVFEEESLNRSGKVSIFYHINSLIEFNLNLNLS